MQKQLLVFLVLAFSAASSAFCAEDLSRGQTLYLPIYSKIWHGDLMSENKSPISSLVSVLVSIRNTSLKTPIKVLSARYYGTDGKFLKEYVARPVAINAMGTYELFVERKESEGGSGANFIIQWESATPTNPPVVEAVHADTRNGVPTITFVTSARPVQADK